MSLPYKSEVMGWSAQQLAEYLRKMNVPGCDDVVLRNSISGSKFVNLSDNDLQRFPKLQAPMISRIRNDISKNNEKKPLFGKKPMPKSHEPVSQPEASTGGGWDDNEFDEDDDYESPYSDDGSNGGDYESPTEDSIGDYEPPPIEPSEDHNLCPSQPIGDGDYIDRIDNRPPPVVCPRPFVSTKSTLKPPIPGDLSSRRDSSPLRKFPPEPPKVLRDIKPGRGSRSLTGNLNLIERKPRPPDYGGKDKEKSQPDASDLPTKPKPPGPPPFSINRSNSSAWAPPSRSLPRSGPPESLCDLIVIRSASLYRADGPPELPALPVPGATSSVRSSPSGEPRGSSPGPTSPEVGSPSCSGSASTPDVDGSSPEVDSSGPDVDGSSPEDKVFNIQIRQQNQQYQLGTGLKAQECFPSVCDIISHYSQSPLVLIDAKNRSSSHQNQCLLSDPAGYYMKRQNWS
ncbi:lymphocyte cytosolic protein 2 [Nothobranchius furzeri]|uniref:Lymphocyte cytosolic protein 2 n=1 Tax=Nothobranchius furzeri TaxID=105023 RepID=A0A9D2XR08_NOTFU|nr:lymphocyte cytosolic protein 2 [Nothobranchius furzeri]